MQSISTEYFSPDLNKTYYISLNGTGDGLSDENPMNVKDVNKTRFYSGDKILFKSG